MNPPGCTSPVLRRAASVALLGLLAAFLAEPAEADSLAFFLDYNYSLAQSETHLAGGEKRTSDSRNFEQEYRLNFDRRIFPHLTVRGGGLVGKIDSSVSSDGMEADSDLTRTNPFLDLLFSTPLLSAGAGFSRLEDRLESSGQPETRLIRNLFSSSFGWRPVDLPSLAMRFSRTETFDAERVQQDQTSDQFQLSSEYRPAEPLHLSYQGGYSATEDSLSGTDIRETANSGRITYDDRFFQERLTVHSNYSISARETRTRAEGAGEVESRIFPLAGLAALDDTPAEGELAVNTALIDAQTGTSSGLDIGLPGFGEQATLRNLGMEFPEISTVNALRLWVVVPSGQDLLGNPTVTNSFVWQVYSSADNIDWTLAATVQPAPFGPFVNRFEIRFPAVRARFIKIAVAPLSPTVIGALNFPDIFVTELEAFLIQPAAAVERSTEQTSHLFNLATKVRLLENPGLDYDFSLFYTLTEPTSVSRLLVSNGLTLRHRLGEQLTMTAQAAREDVDNPTGDQVVYRYGASLSYLPLPTLSHNLVYSGRNEFEDGDSRQRHSIFLNNRAALYQGVDLLANGGVSLASQEEGEETETYLVNLGAVVTPHRTMTWNLNFSADRTERTGGGRPDTSESSRRSRLSLAYNPLAALNFFLAYEIVDQEERRTTLHNYSVNWSSFRDGTLQFSLAYNESLRPEENALDRLIVPSARWEIRRGTFLDVSYAMIRSESEFQETDSRVFSASLRATF